MSDSSHKPPATPWRSHFARLHPRAYLGMHVVVGGLATVALTWVFLAIADEIPEHSALARMDVVVQRWIEGHGTEWGEKIFLWVSYLGSPILIAVIVGVVLWLAWRRDWSRALAVALCTGGGVAVNNILKAVFHRGRPETATEFITRQSWSFPSGHAMNSMIGYGFLTMLLLEHVNGRRQRLGIVACSAILIGAIGFSRVYLGVHYMSDVVGGWIAGGVWLIVCVAAYRFTTERRGGAIPD